MKIAVPVKNGELASHFGHCQEFMFFTVDEESGEVTGSESLAPPPHEPGVLPRWLAENGAETIIAGGMGRRAQKLFSENGIEVVVGAKVSSPDELVSQYVEGSLSTGENLCSH